MKNVGKIIALTLCAAMLLSGCDTEAPQETETAVITDEPEQAPGENAESVPFMYTESKNGDVTVNKYVVDEVVVPETINGSPVTNVAMGSILNSCEAKTLTIEAKIEKMQSLGAFSELSEINLPNTMKEIDPAKFMNCNHLAAVNIEPGGDFCSVDGIVYTADMKTLVCAPPGMNGSLTVPDTVETIGKYALGYCGVSELVLPDGLKVIEDSGCRNLPIARIDIPASVTEIGGWAFRDCNQLAEVKLHDGLEKIGTCAFDGTKLDELYLPDTVTECGKYLFGDQSMPVSVPLALFDGDNGLKDYANVTFRGETMLDTAVRQGINKYSRCELLLFIDLDFDGFPELLTQNVYNSSDTLIYTYSEEEGWGSHTDWKGYYSEPSVYRSDPEVYNNIWLTSIYKEWKDSDYRSGSNPLENVELLQSNETGEQFYRYGKKFSYPDGSAANKYTREDCTVLATFDKDGIKERYKPIGRGVIFDSEFRDKPNGEVQKTIIVGEETISTYPYIYNTIPNRQKVLINGVDIIHGGEHEGVSFDWFTNTLTLDNAVIESTDKRAIDFMDIEYPEIVLVGENRVYSEEKASIHCDTSLTVRGEGTLDVGSIALSFSETYIDHWSRDDVQTLFIECDATVREAEPGSFRNTVAKISLAENAHLICGTEDAPSLGIETPLLKVMENSRVDIVSSDNGVTDLKGYKGGYNGDMTIYVEDDAVMNITAERYGIQERSGRDGILYVTGNSKLNVKAGITGLALDAYTGSDSRLYIAGTAVLTVDSDGVGIDTDGVTIAGGTLEVNNTSGSVAVRTGNVEITGDLISQVGGWGDEHTAYLKIVVQEKEPEYPDYYYSDYGAKAKPVIYLYPEEQTDVSVQVSFPQGGEFTCTYPDYGDGWNVTAMPDGTLYDADGNEYYCLYWEGVGYDTMTGEEGFCVKGEDTAAFLREKLLYIGLTPREANEFIIYWLPKMQDNPYNIISLYTEQYAECVPLSVSPAPDTQIRVFMTYRASDTPVDIPEQSLPHCDRTGFTLVEWGGRES